MLNIIFHCFYQFRLFNNLELFHCFFGVNRLALEFTVLDIGAVAALVADKIGLVAVVGLIHKFMGKTAADGAGISQDRRYRQT